MHCRLTVAYYWPNMFRDFAEYVRRCDVCQHTKIEQDSLAGLMGRRDSRCRDFVDGDRCRRYGSVAEE